MLAKRVNLSGNEDLNRAGRPLDIWIEMLKKYKSKRGTGRRGDLKKAKREHLDKKKWRLFCHGYTVVRNSLKQQQHQRL